MFSAVVELKPPYSFERLLRRLETHPDDQLRVEPESRILKRAFRIDNRPHVVTLRFAGDLEQPRIEVETDASLSAAGQAELLATIRHMFSADVDLAPLYACMTEDKWLRPLTQHFRGLRFLLDPDLFQSMVRTIIGQQLNLAFAATLARRLLQLCGDQVVDRDGHSYLVFPTAEAIARLQVEQLRELQYSQRKAEYIIDFARAVVDGKVELDRLEQMADEEIINHLTALRGVGRWTVECLLMFGMGRPDLLPAADIGLRNGIQLVYRLEDKPDEKEIRRIGESWRPWRSYVSLYVWEAVGAVKRKESIMIQ
ncbi:DNA-3-methyladenine glycosylase [Brevibacillus humidisoli]|uniref:DNA-3-methyladenine glycosylase family protein n=1 Tax=Brevibacillus humidisoli TaxID=2895522 RepID=UPI001E3FE1F9|nr:DNA-3-methyladenine glycosylase [Brevibacillus humidisoli]UFJ41222.1 DNA-3-methyladenine glycosylase [Brevibacillus humidisoli]